MNNAMRIAIVIALGLLIICVSALAQEKDRSKHNPRIDSALEKLISMSLTGNMNAVIQYANQLGIPMSGNMVTVTLEPGRGMASSVVLLIRPLLEGWGIIKGTSRGLIKLQLPLQAALFLQLANVEGVTFIRPPLLPQALAVSEGVELTGATALHNMGFRGQGVKIAVIDLGFMGLSSAQARGELPPNVRTFDFTGTGIESFTSHGTAVAEIIYDMAPQAELFLMKIGDEVDLENAKDEAIRQGVKIINHSVGWFNTSFYDGTGIIADIANSARAAGILWVNAAGNYARRHYKGFFTDTNGNGWHEFASGDESININAGGGSIVQVFMTWRDWPASAQDYDLYLFDNNGNLVAVSDRIQSGTEKPIESLSALTSSPGPFHLKVKADRVTAHKELAIFVTSHDIEHAVPQSSLVSPADAKGAMAVAAINWQNWNTGPQAPYSSQGPTSDGRPKPDISGPDGVSTSTFGGFIGTSASAPHVAGAAALLLSQNPAMGVDQLINKLKQDAVPMGSNLIFGAGRLNLAIVPQPTLKPDLIPATVDWSPRNPRVGDLFNFAITVRNQGSGSSGPFVVEIRDNAGTANASISGLAAGASTSISFSRRLNALTELFTITVDALNQVEESNESNNTTQVRVEAQPEMSRPDLLIEAIDFSPRNPSRGDTISFSVTVTNQSGANAGPFSVEIRDSAGSDLRSLSGLNAFGRTNIGFTRRLNANSETFTFIVDVFNQVDESNESNNTRQITISSTTPPTPTLGIDVSLDKDAYQINERVVIRFRINTRAFVYIYDVDPAGRVSLIFPNAFSPNNLLEAGAYTIPDGRYELRVTGPEGLEHIHALATSQAVDLRLSGQINPAFTDPDTFKREIERRLASLAPGVVWAHDVARFRVTQTSNVNQPPIASFSFSPPEPFVGDRVLFDASASRDPDGRIIDYVWDLNSDGRIDARGVTVTAIYTSAGAQRATLTVIDDKGASSSASQTVPVRQRPSNRPPIASFVFSPREPQVNERVFFDASSSTDPDGRIVDYRWDFNSDGRVDARGVTAYTSFSTAGQQRVTLTVTDDGGLSNSATQMVQVGSSPLEIPSGVAGFFIIGEERLRFVVQGDGAWAYNHSYKIVLETNGAFTELEMRVQGNAAPQTVAPPNGQRSLTLSGSVRNGRVDYLIGLTANASSIKFHLLFDINGDGRLEMDPTIIWIGAEGKLYKLPFVPALAGWNVFSIGVTTGKLLPFVARNLIICFFAPEGPSRFICFKLT